MGHIEDGLYGPIYIHPSDSEERPFSLISKDDNDLRAMLHAEESSRHIVLSDWRHQTSEQLWAAEEATGIDAYCTNSLLVNGKGSVSCLDRETIDKYTMPIQSVLLNGSNLTDTGYVQSIWFICTSN